MRDSTALIQNGKALASPLERDEARRIALLNEYRRRRGEVYRATRAARDAAGAASVVSEWSAETEEQLLRDLRRNGPIEFEGRQYIARKRDGAFFVDVRSTEGGDL